MQTFTGDFPLNYVQNLPVIASESEEKFDLYSSNVAAGMKIFKKLDILEKFHIIRMTHSLPMIHIF